jgi:hypothetical protein
MISMMEAAQTSVLIVRVVHFATALPPSLSHELAPRRPPRLVARRVVGSQASTLSRALPSSQRRSRRWPPPQLARAVALEKLVLFVVVLLLLFIFLLFVFVFRF